jgi:tape measure domain-containing protein
MFKVGSIFWEVLLQDQDFKRGISNVSKMASGLDSSMRKASKGSFAVAAGVTAVGAAITAMILKPGLDRVLNIEDAKAKLKGLGYSIQEVDVIMGSALKSVEGTIYALDEAAGAAGVAVTAGIKPGKELTRYLSLMADAATIAGTDLNDMSSIFGKVQASGKMTGRVLEMMTERNIPMLSWLAKEFGTTEEAMSQMVSSGKVSSEMFQQAIEANIGGAALAAGDTTRGAIANMRTAFARLGAVIMEAVLPAIQAVVRWMRTFTDNISKGIKDAGGPLEYLNKIFQENEKLIVIVAGALVGALVPALYVTAAGMWATFAPLLPFIAAGAALGGIIYMIVQQLGGWNNTLEVLQPYLDKAKTAADFLVGAIKKLVDVITSVISLFTSLPSGVQSTIFKFGGFVAVTYGAVKALQMFITATKATILWSKAAMLATTNWIVSLKNFVFMVGRIVVWLGHEALARIKNLALLAKDTALRIKNSAAINAGALAISRFVLATKQMILTAGQYIVLLARETALKIKSTAQTVAATAATTAKMVVDKLQMVVTKIATAVQAAFNLVMSLNPIMLIVLAVAAVVAALVLLYTKNETARKIIDAAWQALKQVFTTVWNAIVSVITWAWNNIISPIWTAVSWYIQNILIPYFTLLWTIISTAFNVIATIIKWAWDNVISPIWTAISWYISNVLIPGFKLIWAVVSTVFSRVWSWIKSSFDKVKTVFNNVKNWITDMVDRFKSILQSIKDALRNVKDAITKPFKEAFDWITDKVDGVRKSIGRLVPGLKESPSIVDRIESSNAQIKKSFGSMFDYIGEGAGLSRSGLMMATGAGGFATDIPLAQAGNSYQINVNMDGVWTASRADRRSLARDFIDAVNDDLLARGVEPLGQGYIKGDSDG